MLLKNVLEIVSFLWSIHVFFLIAAQAHAICDKAQTGGVHMAGAVGGVSVSGGVVVSLPAHIPPDDDPDSDNVDSEVRIHNVYCKTFWCCFFLFTNIYVFHFVSLRMKMIWMMSWPSKSLIPTPWNKPSVHQ